MNYWVIFLTGLTTGGLTCLAMQGGLLASVIANQKEQELETGNAGTKKFDKLDWMPVGMFLIAKLFIHTVFGFLLGSLGAVITLSLNVRLAFQVFTALFMFATAMNLLNVHPVFRFVMFQPPRFMQRWVKNTTKSRAFFAPVLLGLMTIFIPCGVTQAMEVLAINTGSAWSGALTMFVFVLGTFPLFGAIGVATARLSESLRAKFLKFASVVLIFMALYGINGVLQVLDAPVTFQKLAAGAAAVVGGDEAQSSDGITVTDTGTVQRVTIEASNSGYTPRKFQVKAGKPVELTVATNDTYSCAAAFTFRAFDISAFLEPTDSKTFTFTPDKKGKYTFSCSMGMYSGVMEVI